MENYFSNLNLASGFSIALLYDTVKAGETLNSQMCISSDYNEAVRILVSSFEVDLNLGHGRILSDRILAIYR